MLESRDRGGRRGQEESMILPCLVVPGAVSTSTTTASLAAGPSLEDSELMESTAVILSASVTLGSSSGAPRLQPSRI